MIVPQQRDSNQLATTTLDTINFKESVSEMSSTC